MAEVSTTRPSRLHRQALQSGEKVLGREHPDTLTSMSNLASVLNSQGKYEEAEKMHRRALEMKEVMLGREHPSTLASMTQSGIGVGCPLNLLWV
jgi:hypothetical protein